MSFITISFGPKDPSQFDVSISDPWWNRKSYHPTQQSAYKSGLDQMPIAGVFGFIVIKEDKDNWKVVEEIGAINTSVGYLDGDYFIQPSSKLLVK